jgi:hypothetical protein
VDFQSLHVPTEQSTDVNARQVAMYRVLQYSPLQAQCAADTSCSL